MIEVEYARGNQVRAMSIGISRRFRERLGTAWISLAAILKRTGPRPSIAKQSVLSEVLQWKCITYR